jgi:1-acyl-sn-glycerol-3-phosphate acyltransferase
VLDAIAIAVLEDAVFVTSRDMAESFLIRWLATIGGAVFVERRNRDRRTEELAHLEALLREGRTVVLFPEATSTNGSEILRFRNGLLSCAHRVPGVEIVPVCLQYISVGGRPIDSENRDRIFLYGEMSVGEHLRRIFSNPVVEMEVQYFKPFPARDFATAAEIASHPEFLVRSVFRPVREIA